MAEQIKIEIGELESELEVLQGAIHQFSPYNKTFINETAGALDVCNSDFISKIQSVMYNMKNTKAPKLLEKVQGIYDETRMLADTFEETDNEAAGVIGGQ